MRRYFTVVLLLGALAFAENSDLTFKQFDAKGGDRLYSYDITFNGARKENVNFTATFNQSLSSLLSKIDLKVYPGDSGKCYPQDLAFRVDDAHVIVKGTGCTLTKGEHMTLGLYFARPPSNLILTKLDSN